MTILDRLFVAFEALVKLVTERTDRAFVWSYSVEEATETEFSGRRLSPLCPFDDQPKIPLMPGIAGAGVKPAKGSIALVAFVDGDPSKPRVVGWDQQVPVSITIDASEKLRAGPSAAAVEIAGGGPAVHRVGDLGAGGTFVAAGTPLITYTGEDGLTWTIAGAVVGAVVNFTIAPVTSAAPGKVITKATAGSAKVTCG